ncbi:hypothetical protein JCGZ_24273 [Jatropha curcas]|uniref:Uncharacterized protein n=1 Tax=Jatropha curcas TaxID=180498 RepID=A0A067JZJ0_JATCU|nr:hypothetical protein JCGZ_24273 [Jatropha curcas]
MRRCIKKCAGLDMLFWHGFIVKRPMKCAISMALLMWVTITTFVVQTNCAVVIFGDFCGYLRQSTALINYNGCPLDVRGGMRCAIWYGFRGVPLGMISTDEWIQHFGQSIF